MVIGDNGMKKHDGFAVLAGATLTAAFLVTTAQGHRPLFSLPFKTPSVY